MIFFGRETERLLEKMMNMNFYSSFFNSFPLSKKMGNGSELCNFKIKITWLIDRVYGYWPVTNVYVVMNYMWLIAFINFPCQHI